MRFMQLRDCPTKGYTEVQERDHVCHVRDNRISGTEKRSPVASLLMVALRSSDAVSERSRTSVQWHWEIHINPSSPGSYRHQSFTNKGGEG